jgi:hypothetical protein
MNSRVYVEQRDPCIDAGLGGGVPPVPPVPPKKTYSREAKKIEVVSDRENPLFVSRAKKPLEQVEHLEQVSETLNRQASRCSTAEQKKVEHLGTSPIVTESDIMRSLLAWAEIHAQPELRAYHRAVGAEERKAAARALLSHRVSVEESFAYELPDSLIVKLGGAVDHVFDERERSLAEAIGARLERRIG